MEKVEIKLFFETASSIYEIILEKFPDFSMNLIVTSFGPTLF